MQDFWIGFYEAAPRALAAFEWMMNVALLVLMWAAFVAMFFGLSLVRFWVTHTRKPDWLYWVFLPVKWSIVMAWTGLGICAMNGLVHDLGFSGWMISAFTAVYVVAGIVYFFWQRRYSLCGNYGNLRQAVAGWREEIGKCWRESVP